MKNRFFHSVLMFALIYFVFSFKFIGLSVYGYWKYGGWYWFDDAFIEIFKVSIVAWIGWLIRAKIYLWLGLNKKSE